MSDYQIKEFIEKCLVPASERSSAKELLRDQFLQVENPKEPIRDPLQLPDPSPRANGLLKSGPRSMDIDTDYKQQSLNACTESINGSNHCPILEFQRTNMKNEFRLKGKKNDDNSVSLTLRIADFYGKLSIWFLLFLCVCGGGSSGVLLEANIDFNY